MSIGLAAMMIAVMLLTLVVPLGVMLFLRRRGGAWSEFWIGAGTFVIFAMILEQILHTLVLRSGLGAVIQGNIWLYGLYGGLAAGIFEETGRFLAFRFVLKGRKKVTALSYGIGHGGMEAFLIVGLTMVSNLILGLMYTSGGTLPPELAGPVETLLSTPPSSFLWSGFERLTAMALHMALSVLVFASVRTRRRWLFPAAILIHAAVDFAAVTANAHLPVAATECLVFLLTLLAAAWAARIYKNFTESAENP